MMQSASYDGVLHSRNKSKKEALVVEADEYGNAFLGLSPTVTVLTNVGFDHVEIFP